MHLAPRLVALLLLGLLGVPPLAAQEAVPSTPPTAADSTAAPAEAKRVGTISVVGNVSVDSARIVRSFEVAPGSRFNPDAVRRGIHKLHALGLFDDVVIDQVDHPDRVDLVVRVTERPRIGEIRFSGNHKRDTDDLEKKLFLKVDHPYSPSQVPVQVDSLVHYYREQGFPRAQITADATPDSATGKIKLHFHVSEGERVRITRIEFAGVHAFPVKKLRKQLATKARGFFGGGDFKDETFAEDKEKLGNYFHNHGYRDARVVAHELKPGDGPRKLTLVFTVEEGARYQIGNVTWTGNTVVPAATLEKLWQPRADEVYDHSKIQKVQGLAYAEYAEIGYLYLNVEPQESPHEQKVDVSFTVTEGAPSKVRLIQIAGNLGTREKVIRREIDIHEGDRFKRSALMRSQGDIMRLGFFEDVQLDFAPAESSDVDLAIKVKEKQVGTASAGAGYTAQSGVTGFLELGHNNVLGNGQSLSLHLERGAKRSEYYLSFTEPPNGPPATSVSIENREPPVG